MDEKTENKPVSKPPFQTAPGTGQPAATIPAPPEDRFSPAAATSPTINRGAPAPDPWTPSGELLRQIAATLNGAEATPAVKQWMDAHKQIAEG